MGFGSARATKGVTGFPIDTKRQYGTAQSLWATFQELKSLTGDSQWCFPNKQNCMYTFVSFTVVELFEKVWQTPMIKLKRPQVIERLITREFEAGGTP